LLFPTIDEVLDLHKQAIEEFGGAHGLRDEAALESALMAAGQITRDQVERIFTQKVTLVE